VLDVFIGALGLHTNVSKCQFTLIAFLEDQSNAMLTSFPCQLIHFSYWYLGISLSIHKLKKAKLQPLVGGGSIAH
jgi:hypothetical protein